MAGQPEGARHPFLRARLARAPRVRAEVTAARAWGVPRSVFLGRVVRKGEPLWTDEDRAYALALAAYEADLCPDCGQPLSESTATDERGRPLHAYDVDLPDICGGCAVLVRDLPDYDDDERRRAMKFRVVKAT